MKTKSKRGVPRGLLDGRSSGACSRAPWGEQDQEEGDSHGPLFSWWKALQETATAVTF